MAHEVKLPQMGESIAEGTVTTWLKKIGDQVKRDEPLFEISTDKVDAEIPSPVAGVLLEIKVQPGTTVPINTVVALIGEAGEVAAAAPTPPSAPTPAVAVASAAAPAVETAPSAVTAEPAAVAATPVPALTPPSSVAAAAERRQTKSSPLVRNIAAAHQIDLATVPGTGLSGRVTKTDILAAVDSQARPAPAAGSTSNTSPAVATPAAGSGELPPAYRPRVLDGDRVEELSVMRQKIAEHMGLSRQVSAHVQTLWEVDYSRVNELRLKYKAVWASEHGVPLTYTAFVMKAVIAALNTYPVVNASLDGTRVIYHRAINLGLAVALDWGLIVPVVHNAGELNLLGLARRAADLAERARVKKLKPEEVQAGTFTITNPGLFGSLVGLPIINQPQVAILGVGVVEKRPVVVDDMIAIRPRGYLSLSFDHRLVDGAIADHFMAKIKATLESFDEAEM